MERPRLAGVFGQLLNAVDDAAGEVAGRECGDHRHGGEGAIPISELSARLGPVTISEMPGRGIDHEEH